MEQFLKEVFGSIPNVRQPGSNGQNQNEYKFINLESLLRNNKPVDPFKACVADRAAHPENEYKYVICGLECSVESVSDFNWFGKIKIPADHPDRNLSDSEYKLVYNSDMHVFMSMDETFLIVSPINQSYCYKRDMRKNLTKPYIGFDQVRAEVERLARKMAIRKTICLLRKLQSLYANMFTNEFDFSNTEQSMPNFFGTRPNSPQERPVQQMPNFFGARPNAPQTAPTNVQMPNFFGVQPSSQQMPMFFNQAQTPAGSNTLNDLFKTILSSIPILQNLKHLSLKFTIFPLCRILTRINPKTNLMKNQKMILMKDR